MNRNEEWEQLKTEYHAVRIPEEGIERIQNAVRRAEMDKKRTQRAKRIRNFGIGAAAAAALVILPNTNQDIAYAMGSLPVIGGLFRVVTVREYTHDDGHNTANVDIPMIVPEDTGTTESASESGAVAQVNKSVEEYTEELITQFERDMQNEGYLGLDVSYETVTDTPDWFTLKITGLMVQASGYEFHRYYNIDRRADSVMQLKDLFPEGADYITPISAEIRKQMREQMKADTAMYFLDDPDMEDSFETIKENQNYYLDADGNLFIAFDEYEVGPGYIGSPVFAIPSEVTETIRKGGAQ